MNKTEEALAALLGILIAIYVVILVTVWADMARVGPEVPQGTPIVILSNTTIVKDGQICQSVEKANIAFTGENGPKWYRMRTLTGLFPTVDFYVVKQDGTMLWVNYKNIADYDPVKSYCSPVVQ